MKTKHLACAGGSLLLSVLLNACAKDAPPPIVSLEGRSCGTQFDLTSAKMVPFDDDDGATIALDQSAQCIAAGGVRSTYAVFALPPSDQEYLLKVTSVPLGIGLFPPRVIVLDQNSAVVREVPRDTFLFHGASLAVGLRIHAGEHYLVVESDPDSVGKSLSQIVDGTTATPVYSGGYAFTAYGGTSANRLVTYSYNGTVNVVAVPVPKGG